MRAARRVASALTTCVLAVGCSTVPTPDADAWRDQARQALDDVASQVATARLTLDQLREDQLPAAYGEVVVAEAEEAAGVAEDGLSAAQPPRRLRPVADRVLTLIGRAVEAVRRARETVVAGDYDAPGLLAALDRLQRALDARRARL